MKTKEYTMNNYDKHKEAVIKYQSKQSIKEIKRRNAKELAATGYMIEWRQNNPDKLKQYGQKRTQNKKHKISKQEWLDCKEYFNHSCAYCELHVNDHYRMWSGELKKIDLHKEHVDDERANDLSNCVPACQSCNSSKHTFDFEAWYSEYEYFSKERLDKINKWLSEDYKEYIKTK
ncbi:HNH endonuclease [Ureibacillus chungkukjangi]|uniref:HNH endonuclease n=1 Tax=Ureibacillus chungkukjangi TaxID=1202712 RepID=UPI00203F66C2|nr:HNH endonuclease [Ureibacillus chungkukjangi]MCM3387253.1 HNH endonuclease [Ureibacillus chungkukjangi]